MIDEQPDDICPRMLISGMCFASILLDLCERPFLSLLLGFLMREYVVGLSYLV